MTTSPAATPSPRATAFLQANKDAFRQLVTFVDFAAEKFTLGFVSVNFAEDRATIIEALQQHPDCQNIQFVLLKFDDRDLRFLRDELIKKLPEIEREPNKKLVLLLTGLEASIGMVGDYPPVLQDLNYVRDGFAASAPYPIVVFLPDYSLTRVAKFAPDFWAWRMAVIRFESSSRTVKSNLNHQLTHILRRKDLRGNDSSPRGFQPILGLNFSHFKSHANQLIRLNSQSELNETKENIFESVDSYAKRDIIPRLLMEYEVGSLAQDEDAKSFKVDLITELGITLYDDDDFDIAKDILMQALEAENSEQSTISKPKAHCYLGIIERQQNNYEHALDLLSQAIAEFEGLEENQLYPDLKEWLKKVIANRGITYWLMEHYPEAIADLTRAIEIDPDDDWAIANRGVTYRLMEHYPEAITDLSHAIEIDPEYDWAIVNRGITYRQMDRYSEALADFNRAIELDPDYKWAIANRGMTYRWMECYPEAIADLNRAIELDSEYKWAISNRGLTYWLMEHYSEAIADFNRAIELDPDDDWAIAWRGETYRGMKQYLNALADLNRAVELDSQSSFNLASRGQVNKSLQHYEAAIKDFDGAIKLDVESAWKFVERGETYRLMERYPEAIADLNRAIEIDPEYKWAIVNRGFTYQLMERYPEALADFNRTIALDPNYERAIVSRGATYQLMERYPEAITDLNRAIEIDPDHKWWIAYRGFIYQQMERYPEAIADFNRAIELDPDDELIAERGKTYRLMEHYAEALQDYNLALELDSNNPEYLNPRGLTYQDQKLYEKAIEDFTKAIEIDPEYKWAIANRGIYLSP